MSSKRFRLRFTFWLDVNKSDEAKIAETVEDLKQDRLFAHTVRNGIRLITSLRDGNLDVLFELFPWVKAEFMEYIHEVQPMLAEESSASETPDSPPLPVVQQTPQQLRAEKQWLEAEQERLEAERQWHERRIRDAEKALEAEREKIATERRQNQSILQQQLERLEQLLLQQGDKPISGGLQPLGNGGRNVSNTGGLNSLNVSQFSVPRYEDEDFALEVSKAKGGNNATQNFLKSMQALQQ